MITKQLVLFNLLMGSAFLATAAEKKPTFAPTNYPLRYFTERLAGDFATILYEIPADQDPAFWKPNDTQIAKIQQADLIIMNGASYEKWAVTAPLPFEGIVDTSFGFYEQYIEVENARVHSHGNGEVHSHGGTAFTVWLDLQQARQQAQAIKVALIEDFPAHEAKVTKAYTQLADDLNEINEAMAKAASGLQGGPVLASHPIYQYWGRAYGVQVEALEWEPEMTLDAKALSDLTNLMKKNPSAKYFFWEGQPAPGHIETLQKMGLTSIIVAPCFSEPESGDFLTTMKENIANISRATATPAE